MEKDNIIDKRDDDACVVRTEGDSVANIENKSEPDDDIGLIAKLKKIKHKEIIVAVLVILIAIVAYTFYVSSEDKVASSESDSAVTLTDELESVLSSIKGVGDLRLLIVYNGGDKLEIASKVDRHTTIVNDEGRVTETIDEVTTPILVNGDQPLVIGKTRAKIDGVIVVCEGGGDPAVRVAVMSAIATLLNVKYDSINVLDME